MKTLSTLLLAFLLLSCSSDSNEDDPQLSFEINDGLRFASSEISVTNTTTNYSGNFIWEVTSASESLTFSTRDLTFTPRFVERYNIILRSSDGDLEFNTSIAITRPNIKTIKSVRLENIPENYEELYLIVKKSSPVNPTIVVYSSNRITNVNSQNLSSVLWEIAGENGTFSIGDPIDSGIEDFAGFTIEFFDGQDNFVTRLDPIFNFYPEGSAFDAGEIPLNSSTQDCMNCASFETLVEIEFGI